MASMRGLSMQQALGTAKLQAKTARPSSLAAWPHQPKRSSVSTAAIKEIFMPALSSTMTEGKIVSWLKSEGDAVTKGEPILVVESDKADMDVESFNKGVLAAIAIGEGERAPVGSPIGFTAETEEEVAEAKKRAAALTGGSGGGAAPAAPAAPAATAPPPPPPPQPAPAPAAPAPAPAAPAPAAAAPAAPAPVGRADGRIIATPYAKQLAKELKVDLKAVGGTGPNGRITASDVERAAGRAPAVAAAAPAAPAAAAAPVAAAPAAAAPAAAAPAAAAGPKPTTVNELRGTTVPFTTLQHAVNRNMTASLAVPEFRVAYQIYTDKLDDLYKKLKPKGVTMTGLLAKACGVALTQHPMLNASVTPDSQGYTHGSGIDIAMAVTMADGGLITPILKDCDMIDIYQLSRNWADLVKRARSKQLSPAEYSGANFTISNMGMYGVSTFDAILPPGTAGILAVAAAKPTVVASEDGMIGVKKVMTVNLTCDHRLVYGAQASEFLMTLKSVVENPDQLVM